ncbi:MAG: hypothetical protein J2P41_00335 [Blastocatellia bacterium]|nr:hypothetical protein [Blastocatellia bacterium]
MNPSILTTSPTNGKAIVGQCTCNYASLTFAKQAISPPAFNDPTGPGVPT